MKTDNFPIPEVKTPEKRRCIVVPVPDDEEHVQIFAGWMRQLTLWFNWQRDEGKSGKDLAGMWLDIFSQVDWSGRMSCGCCNDQTRDGSAPLTRYRITESNYWTYEISYDGGDTWVTSPEWPIATSPDMPAPVGTTVDTKCDACYNGLGHIQDIVQKHSDTYDTAASAVEWILAVAAAILLTIFTGGTAAVLIPALIGAASVAYAIGKAAWDAYWTSDVWEVIVCCLYCTIGDDGKFTDEQFAAFLAKYSSDLPAGIPKDMLYRDCQAIGPRGLSNLCAYGAITSGSDCTACDCVGCDLSTWVSISGLETDVVKTPTQITGTAYSGGDGNYYASFVSGANNQCCCGIQINVVGGGGFSAIGVKACGSDRMSNDGINYSYVPGAATPINRIEAKRNMPFDFIITGVLECE